MRIVTVSMFLVVALAMVPAQAHAGEGPAAVAKGSYECWGNGQARMMLNFTITGAATYRASDDSTGKFKYDRATGRIAFTGYLKEAMPDSFYAVYHEPKGRPTVSFRSGRDSEASFCERAGR